MSQSICRSGLRAFFKALDQNSLFDTSWVNLNVSYIQYETRFAGEHGDRFQLMLRL
jgi:hypothetical protein